MRKLSAIILFGLLLCGGWKLGSSSWAADDRVAQAGDSGPIELSRCRVQLIDEVVLASDRPGILAFVEPKEGHPVTAGQQIAGLKDDIPQAQYNIAKKKTTNDVETRFAIKSREVAQAEYEKAIEANEIFGKGRGPGARGAVPESELRRLKLSAEKAELQIEQAQHEFEILGLELQHVEAELKTYQVIAPFDGVVTKVHKSEGEAVRQGDPILEVVSTKRLRVEGQVEIKDIWRVKAGAAVQVQIDIPDVILDVEKHVFEGRIVFVDESVDPVFRKAIVWAEVANPNAILKAGLPAKMVIFPDRQAEAATALKATEK